MSLPGHSPWASAPLSSPLAAPPGGRETGWTWFALVLRMACAILGMVLLVWATFKMFIFRVAIEADPGLPAAFYEEPTLRDYLRGSTLPGDAVVLGLLVVVDQHVRFIRRRLRASWNPPQLGTRSILTAYAVVMGGAVLWLLNPFVWGASIHW